MSQQIFKSKLGQIDYTDKKIAPVINCIVKYQDKILIVKRAKKMHFYPNFWSGVSGFLDDRKTVRQKALEEINEELGLNAENIISIHRAKPIKQVDEDYHKTWLVNPVLIEVNTNKIKLDWEAQKYRWIYVDDLKKYDLVPGFWQVVSSFYYEIISKKYCASAVIILNKAEELLLVKPNYRSEWLLPGGVNKKDESPRAGALREIKEELGLDLKNIEFLAVDYKTVVRNVHGDNLQFVFGYKYITDAQIKKIKLDKVELEEHVFVSYNQTLKMLAPGLRRRLPAAYQALINKKGNYLEDGKIC